MDAEIFKEVGLYDSYQRQTQAYEGEIFNTIYIPSKNNSKRTFILGHGFGGTSLMYFPIFKDLITQGNILVWELRGMGFGLKKPRY